MELIYTAREVRYSTAGCEYTGFEKFLKRYRHRFSASCFLELYTYPSVKNFEEVLEVQLFRRFNLTETGCFNLESIPELQESEDAQSNRDIAEINAGLKTINDVLKSRGQDPKPWGDIWYRASSLVPECSEKN